MLMDIMLLMNERVWQSVTGEEKPNEYMFSNDVFGRVVLSEQKEVQT